MGCGVADIETAHFLCSGMACIPAGRILTGHLCSVCGCHVGDTPDDKAKNGDGEGEFHEADAATGWRSGGRIHGQYEFDVLWTERVETARFRCSMVA